jgi:hypothetical protein
LFGSWESNNIANAPVYPANAFSVGDTSAATGPIVVTGGDQTNTGGNTTGTNIVNIIDGQVPYSLLHLLIHK